MTLGDLNPDVKLYSEVEKSYNYDWGRRGWEREMGGGSGRTYGKGWRGREWQGDEELGTGWSVRVISPEIGRERNVWGEEMAPPLQSCARCVLLTASEH